MPKANINGQSKSQLVRQFKAEHPGLADAEMARQMTAKYGTTFTQGTVSAALTYKFKKAAKPVEAAKKSRFQMVRDFVAANPSITSLKDISAAASKEYGVKISGPLVWQAMNRGPGTKRVRRRGLRSGRRRVMVGDKVMTRQDMAREYAAANPGLPAAILARAASKHYKVKITEGVAYNALKRGKPAKASNGHADSPVADMISASKFVKAVGIDRAKALVELIGKLLNA